MVVSWTETSRVLDLGGAGEFGSAPELERIRRMDLGISWTAHELRAPLMAVRAALEVVGNEPGVDPRRAAIVQQAVGEVDRLAATVEAILGWAAGTRDLNRRETDIAQLVQEAVETCRLAGAHGFDVKCHDAPLVASVDAEHLRAAVSNLLRNARTYAEPGSRIQVKVEGDGAHVVVSVSNRGPEIPVADRERIFDPFVRGAAGGGSGLGLFIARRVVAAHGGRILMESEGSRTTFHVMLPVEEADSLEPSSDQESASI